MIILGIRSRYLLEHARDLPSISKQETPYNMLPWIVNVYAHENAHF